MERSVLPTLRSTLARSFGEEISAWSAEMNLAVFLTTSPVSAGVTCTLIVKVLVTPAARSPTSHSYALPPPVEYVPWSVEWLT